MEDLRYVKSKFNNGKGFTLIEVLIAMVVFAIGILAITGMQISATQGNQSARLRTEAVSYASEYMENLISQGYAAVTNGSATEGPITIAWTVKNDTPIAGSKTITVTGTWNDQWGARSVDMNYIKYNPN